MKCQRCSWKNKENVIKLSSAEFSNSSVSVNTNNCISFRYRKNLKSFYIVHPTWWSKVSPLIIVN